MDVLQKIIKVGAIVILVFLSVIFIYSTVYINAAEIDDWFPSIISEL